jgi:hypothetical protein
MMKMSEQSRELEASSKSWGDGYNRSGSRPYRRWEVCVSNKFNLNSYVGYCKAQFTEEKRRYIVLKARGSAIENAIKVMQLVKETIGGIHSCIFMNLHASVDRSSKTVFNKEERNDSKSMPQ